MIISGVCGICRKYFQGDSCECQSRKTGNTLNFIPDFHEAYYDNALGCVVKSRQHRAALMKEKGLFEVGNEKKYVDPEINRRKRESEDEKTMEVMKKEAYRLMERATWN